MSVQQSDMYTGEARGWDDDEIDLGRYLLVAGAWWREIVVITLGLTLLAALAAWGWQSLQIPQYAASSDVVIARLNSQVALDERITTSEEIQQGGAAAWRASLLQLAQSPAIAQSVLEELTGQIDDEWTAQNLVKSVEISNPAGSDTRTLSDLIRITVRTGDPQQSALIANTWAAHYIDHVNQVYGQVPGDTLAALQSELETTHAAYLEAEATLQSYIAGSQADGLQRQIDEKLALRTNLQLGRDSLLAAVANQDRNARLSVFNNLVAAQIDSTNQVFTQTIQADIAQLNQLIDQRDLTQVQLAQARNLATQLEQADPSTNASNALALQLLKAQVFARPVRLTDQPSSIDLNLDLSALAGDSEALLADARVLVTTLEGHLAWLVREITRVSDQLLEEPDYAFLDRIRTEQLAIAAPVAAGTATTATQELSPYAAALAAGYAALFDVSRLVAQIPDLNAGSAPDPLQQTIVQLDSEIQRLRSQLAAEQATERQLTQQRDLTWTAYETLSNKQAELNLTRTVANSEVRLGAPAVPPVEPEPGRSLALIIAAVGVASLIFALALALIANAAGRKPLLARA